MHDDNDRLPFSRRSLIQGAVGLGATGWFVTPAAADGFGGGGGGDGGGGGSPSGSGDGPSDELSITLITGQTIHVEDRDGRRQLRVEGDVGAYRKFETDAGSYVIPNEIDLTRFSKELFNIDLLIEQGMTDQETDATPVIISMATDVSEQASVASLSTGSFSHRYTFGSINGLAGDIAKDRDGPSTQDGTSGDIVDQLATAEDVEQVYLDVRAEASLDEAAPAVNAAAARDEFGVDGAGVTVAVLDTGVDADHPDFEDRVVDRADFSGDGDADRNGHGTHVAGIAAGAGVENGDLVGMAPGADIMAVKVLDDGGSGAFSDIIAGIEYAVDNGADVINMSLGGPPQADDPLAAATNAAAEAGVLPAVAAGNSFFPSLGGVNSPGIAEKATTVAATAADNGIAYFSQKGPSPFEHNLKPEVAAPGADVNAPGSEDAGEYPYTRKGGTSMATPVVAGVAALLIEDGTADSPQDIEEVLVATGDRVDGESVFSAGGGEINAQAALDASLLVRDGVVNFGIVEEATTKTATVTLENTGDSTVEVTANADLRNIQYAGDSGEDISDQVSVSPGSVTVEAGATATVELSIDGGDAFGYNSGYLTFETGTGETAHTIFGFVRGIAVDVEKLPHPDSNGVAGDSLLAFAHDGAFSHLGTVAFDDSGHYSFVALDDGGKYTLWSGGQLAPPDGMDEGDPTWTVAEVELSTENASFTIDESETVPRQLDTSGAAEYAPFEMRRFDANVYANYEDGPANSASLGFIGDFGLSTAHYTPVATTDPTNVGNFYQILSGGLDREYAFDVDTVFNFFDGALELPASGAAVEVHPDELAEEKIRYHRTVEDQLWSISPATFPADLEHFPTLFILSFSGDVSDDRVEQTFFLNDQTAYDESWDDDGPGFFGRYQLKRNKSVFDGDYYVPEMGRTYDQTFNRDPVADILTTWELSDGALEFRGQWYGDAAEEPYALFQYSFDNSNTWSVAVDGAEAAAGSSYYWEFPTTTVEDISPGSTVDVSLEGNVLVPTPRANHTESNWQVTYEPGTANTPPQIARIDVRGLSTLNEVPAGPTVAFVDVDYWSDGLEDLTVWYAPAGAGTSPFDGWAGWTQAMTRYAADGRYGVLLNTAGYTGRVDLAVEATDTDGNRVQKLTEQALTVSEGADVGVPTVLRPDEVNAGTNQRIPIDMNGTDGFDPADVVAHSLRLGSPLTVHGGGGAAPVKTTVLGNGTLRATFPVGGTAFACSDPAAAQVAGELTDGTAISGADVIPTVNCPDEG